jgi:hypothetical protein
MLSGKSGPTAGLPLTKLKIIAAFLDFFSSNFYVDTDRNLNKSLFV